MSGDFCLATPLVEHQGYLTDRHRLAAYEAALAELVRPGDVVLDLGCGSGVLGLLALRAGARQVYAVDDGPVLELARQIARDNGLADRVTHVRGHSSRIALVERADVLIADQMSPFGLGAGLVPCFRDAAARLLKPGARSLPCALELRVAPVSLPKAFARVSSFAEPSSGLDVTAGQPLMQNMGQNENINKNQLLAATQAVASFPLPQGPGSSQRAQLRFVMERDDTVHGLMGCFQAQLSPGVAMSNDPSSPNAIEREQLFLPMGELAVKAGEALRAEVHIHHQALVLSWRLWREADSPPALRSTFKGMLLSSREMAAASRHGKPRLDALGRARLTALLSCAEEAQADAIEETVWQRHADAFLNRQEAALFVTRVLRENTTH